MQKFIALLFSLFVVCTSLGVSTPNKEYECDSMGILQTDTLKLRNEQLFHHFVMALAYVESGHTSKITSDRNADGQTSYGWVQITPIFVKQANINKHLHETGVFTAKPKPYYKIKDAYDLDKSKEMLYWVNKKLFDKYDKNGLEYDIALWRKILLVHNPKAKPKYRNSILSLYKKNISEL